MKRLISLFLCVLREAVNKRDGGVPEEQQPFAGIGMGWLDNEWHVYFNGKSWNFQRWTFYYFIYHCYLCFNVPIDL